MRKSYVLLAAMLSFLAPEAFADIPTISAAYISAQSLLIKAADKPEVSEQKQALLRALQAKVKAMREKDNLEGNVRQTYPGNAEGALRLLDSFQAADAEHADMLMPRVGVMLSSVLIALTKKGALEPSYAELLKLLTALSKAP